MWSFDPPFGAEERMDKKESFDTQSEMVQPDGVELSVEAKSTSEKKLKHVQCSTSRMNLI